jgi:SAM-dependent methyltransferase
MNLIDMIYENELIKVSDICEYLKVEITPSSDRKFIYGELTRIGVEQLYMEINNIKETKNKVFTDIGSGNGKLISHLSIISDFKKINGIEISKLRIKYSNILLNNLPKKYKDKINLIEGDFNNLEIDSDFIFLNDCSFHSDCIYDLVKKIKKETVIITTHYILGLKNIKNIRLDTTWKGCDWNIYIIY